MKLLPYRIIVLPDNGQGNTGRIVEENLRGNPWLLDHPEPENPEDPPPVPVLHDHIVFVKELSTEMEIDSVTHRIMHINAVLCTINGD